MKPTTPVDIEPDSPVDQAAELLIAAVRHYQDTVKRHHRANSWGVWWLRFGNELICYTQSARYANQVMSMTHDTAKDQLHFAQAPDTDEAADRITTRYRELEDDARRAYEANRDAGENI